MVQEAEKENDATLQEKQQDPTPQETVESLRAKLLEKENELNKTKETVRGLNATLQERAKQLKEQTDLRVEITSLREDIELLATAQTLGQQGEADEMGEVKKQRPDVLKLLQDKNKEREDKGKERDTQNAQLAYNQRADSIWARAQAAIKDDSDTLEDIKAFLVNGLADIAERQVAKAERVAKTARNIPEVNHDKEIEEKARKMLEESGQLGKTSTNPPGGGSGKIWTTSQIADMDTKTFIKTFPNGMVDVLRLKEEGKVVEK